MASGEIVHASLMRPTSGVAVDPESEEHKELGTIQVPAEVLADRDLGETVTLTVHGVYTAKHGKQATLTLMEVTPSGEKNHADAEEKRLRGDRGMMKSGRTQEEE